MVCERRCANFIALFASVRTERTPTAMADQLQHPALETPPDVVSRFPTTHSDEQAWFYVSATLSAVVPGTLLLLRLYTKLHVVRKVDLTDCSLSPFRLVIPISNKDVDITILSFVSQLESEMILMRILT